MIWPKFTYNDLVWVEKTWTAPDGKIVPFEEADLSPWMVGDDPDWSPNDANFEVLLTRWPRKVTITCIVTEGIEDWTGDGDGDGKIWVEVSARQHTLIITDRYSLEQFFEEIIQQADRKFDTVKDSYYHGRN